MRPIPTILAAVSAMSILFACSGETTTEDAVAFNAVNDQGMVEVNANGPASPPVQATEAADVGEQPSRSEAPQPQPKVRATTPARPDRAPPPKAPPQSELDPHAGHDMGDNMHD